MDRRCMFCDDPIAECMGKVIPRDVLPVLEAVFAGRAYVGPQPRELCWKDACGAKWQAIVDGERTVQGTGPVGSGCGGASR